MKSFRGTFIFTLIVLAVGFFSLQEFKKSKTEQEEKITQDHLFRDLKVEDVTYWEHLSKYALKRSESGWKLSSPVEDDADDEAVNSHFRSVFTQTVESLDINGANISVDESNKRYGFDSPLATFKFNTVNGEEHQVVVGSVLTYDKGYYIKKNSVEKNNVEKNNSAVIWVGTSGWEPLVGKSYNDLRLKTIKFGEDDISRLQIKYKVEKNYADLIFKKNGAKWEYSSNKKMLIDSNAVEDFLRKIKNLRAETIVEDRADVAAIKRQNLDKANLTIVATLAASVPNPTEEKSTEEKNKNQEKDIKVSFYLPKSGDSPYMSTSNTPIYRTTLANAKDFIKNIDDFRDKSFLFRFDQNLAKRLEVKNTNIGEVYLFEKLAPDWVLQNVTGAKANKRGNQSELTSFLTELNGLKADRFYGSLKKFKSEGEIILQKDKNEILFSMLYGGLHKDADGRELYMVKTNLSDETVAVSKATLSPLISKKLIEDVPAEKTKEETSSQKKAEGSK